jgi:hypothetical protein
MVGAMTADTQPATEPAAGSVNGKTDAKPARPPAPPAPRAQHAAPAPAEDEAPCADCAEADGGRGAAGLGLLILGVAGGLAFIGLDLATGGALSRRLGARAEDDGE